MCAFHGTFGALAAQLLFGQTGHHNRQLMWGQCIGVMQHRSHGQVLTAHGTIDDHLQTFDGREDVDRPPIAASTVVVEDQG